MAFRWIGFDNSVRRRGEKAVDVVRTGDRLRFRAAVALELGPDTGERSEGRSSLIANQTTSFFLVSVFGSGVSSTDFVQASERPTAISTLLPMGTAKDLDTAKAEFKAAWEALKARTPPEQLAAAYKAMNIRDDPPG
jgi:hypothetical protein